MSDTDWKFDCRACGHTEPNPGPMFVCPKCGKDGFAIINTGPIVESAGWPVTIRRQGPIKVTHHGE